MNNKKNALTGSVLLVLAVSLMGCGQSFKSSGPTPSTNGSQSVDDYSSEMSKAEAANAEALAAIEEANAAIASITDSKGNINVGLFTKSKTAQVQTQGLADPILNKIRPVFDNLFARVTTVKTKFTEARTLLLGVLAKLDNKVPAQAAIIQQVMTQLAGIDAMEKKFSTSMHLLAGKLDLATSALDKLVSGVTSFIPGFGWVADLALDFLVMGDIKNYIAEIKMQLLML